MPLQNQILLVDGYAAIYRSFHAIRNLNNPRGQAVNALYGMARFALKLDEDFPSRYSALVLDKGKCTRRIELLKEYKANRPPMPDELQAQIPRIREWFEAMGWPLLEEEGREADDLIALAVERRDSVPALIVSHDKDLAQLVEEDVLLLRSAGKGSWEQMGPDEVREKFGVPPELIGDYLALVGDSSDNIPGVRGVGPKTAAALLQKYGSIEGILDKVQEIKAAAVRSHLAEARNDLKRNRDLVRLDIQESADWPGLAGLQRRRIDWEHLLDIARAEGFKSLLSRLEQARDEARCPRFL